VPRHAAYLAEAIRLREKYSRDIHILVGFESEWIRSSDLARILSLASDPVIDYVLGSVHHTAGIPIDFDAAFYAAAVKACGGTEEGLYRVYYDDQLEMLQGLRPRVVGHFDLVRLLSQEPGRLLRGWGTGVVWEKVVRNLQFIQEYGGLLECNTAALRKGLAEPYPAREVAQEWLRIGGRFTFSDDSHGVSQVATNYTRGLDYLESLGVTELWALKRLAHGENDAEAQSSPQLVEVSVSVQEFRESLKLASA
jgi:histidinol-phosphatase (PHP family)